MTRYSETLHGGARRLPTRLTVPGTKLRQTVSWYVIAPNDACAFHVHSGKTETWLVIDGRGVAKVGDRTFDVGPGDLIIAEPGTPHGLTNAGDQALRFVNIVALDGAGPVTTRELG